MKRATIKPKASVNSPKLIVKDGRLYTSFDDIVDRAMRNFHNEADPILIYGDGEGGAASIAWPQYDAEHLRSALFDCRETGELPECKTVLLPDGTVFTIDS